jgi:hypothetical protein
MKTQIVLREGKRPADERLKTGIKKCPVDFPRKDINRASIHYNYYEVTTMNFASIPHATNEIEANMTPAEMAEYNDYLDSLNVGTRDPQPEDFIETFADKYRGEMIDDMPIGTVDESTRIETALFQIKIGDSIVIDSVLVKRTDRHTFNAQRKWKVYDESLKRDVYRYGNWALQGYDAKEVTDYILDVPKVLFTIREVSK